MEKESRLFTPVLLIGCSIVLVGFAIRASFGVFQIPIQEEFGWPRSEFSLAIAIQNLAWGFGAPFFGAFAEKIGDKKAIILEVQSKCHFFQLSKELIQITNFFLKELDQIFLLE